MFTNSVPLSDWNAATRAPSARSSRLILLLTSSSMPPLLVTILIHANHNQPSTMSTAYFSLRKPFTGNGPQVLAVICSSFLVAGALNVLLTPFLVAFALAHLLHWLDTFSFQFPPILFLSRLSDG